MELNSSKKVDLSSRIDCFNLDGRDFLRDFALPDIAKRVVQGGSAISKKEFFVVMNLPAMAIEFLDVFVPGCFDDLLGDGGGGPPVVAASNELTESAIAAENGESSKLASPNSKDFSLTIFCYCFSNAEDLDADVRQRVDAVLRNAALKPEHCEIRQVRNVAPKKEMLVAKISLTPGMLLTFAEPPLKKLKTDLDVQV